MKQAPPAPACAAEVFGHRLDLARRYADLLAGPGVERGLLGPREADRLWDRHILNSAAAAELIGPGAQIVDIGSGAGLPGIPLAIARPDLRVTLVEPMLRRTQFLESVIADLAIDGVDVRRGRAEDPGIRAAASGADAVVSRAVSGLETVARWSIPLLRPGGRMLALKGDRAQDEIDESRDGIARMGGVDIEVVRCGRGRLDQPATVVVVTRGEERSPARARRQPRGTERRRP